MKNILIIGFGRLGSNLYYNLNVLKKYKLSAIKEHFKPTRKNIDLIDKADIIFLCVQDGKLNELIKTISKLRIDFNDKFFFHTSGAITSEVFGLLKKKGAHCSSFHPVQTFAKKTSNATNLFKGVYLAIEGNKKSNKIAKIIAKKLGLIPFEIAAKDKIYHHICCVISSNYMTAMFDKINEINDKIKINGFKKTTFLNIYTPLIYQTIKNITSYGAEYSLTGPIARNDVDTIKKQLEILKKESKEILHFYIFMGIETAKFALKIKSITKKESDSLIKLFKNYSG
jgi:predicted short-subunit dehydrogenase-like oxidoreductase (DUF2520 family)